MLPALALALLLPAYAPAQTPAAAADWTQVYYIPDFEVVQNGYVYGFPIAFPFEANELKITFADAADAVCGAVLDSVEVTQGTAGALPTAYPIAADGVIKLQGSPEVYNLKINLHQPLYARSYCQISIAKRLGGIVDDTSGFIYQGVIHYQGGFVNQTEIALTDRPVVTSVKVAVPDFCQNVQVLETGTVTEGQYDRAQATSTPGVFAVNSGTGSRIAAIKVTLNGPLTSQCDIPVYVRTRAEN